MIVLFTDFGFSGPYTGQLKAVFAQTVPQVPIIDLFADAPVHSPHASAHLLAAYQAGFPADTVFTCVVDPGVGSNMREPVVLRADGHWYVGPHNGLFDVIAARSARVEAWRILWRPKRLSASFHGRDLFAPVAAMIAGDAFPEAERLELLIPEKAAMDLLEVIYIDHFGNLITGLRAESCPSDATLQVAGQCVTRATTFADVERGQPLCYENSSGLMEIALNCGRAEEFFSASVGDSVTLMPGP